MTEPTPQATPEELEQLRSPISSAGPPPADELLGDDDDDAPLPEPQFTPIKAALCLRGIVPPGQTLFGVYPQQLFRIDRFSLPYTPELSVVIGGQVVACEGQTVEHRSHERTVCVGAFLAFDVRNSAPTHRALVLTVEGLTIEGPSSAELEAVTGEFVKQSIAACVEPKA